MSIGFKVEGLAELEKQLAKLEPKVAKRKARKAMRKALVPVRDAADSFWPGSTPKPFKIGTRIKGSQPQPAKGGSIVNLFVGSGEPHAHLIEFGTGPRRQTSTGRYTGVMPAQPMLQPAWDSNRGEMLAILRRELGAAITRLLTD